MTRTRSEPSVPSPLPPGRHLRRADPRARRVEARAGQERPDARRPSAHRVRHRVRARLGCVRRASSCRRTVEEIAEIARHTAPRCRSFARPRWPATARRTSSGSGTCSRLADAGPSAGTASRSCARPARSGDPSTIRRAWAAFACRRTGRFAAGGPAVREHPAKKWIVEGARMRPVMPNPDPPDPVAQHAVPGAAAGLCPEREP